MSLPVLADPFWGRAAFPVRSRCGKTASILGYWAELCLAWTAEGGCPYASTRRVYVRGDPRRWKAVSCRPGRRDPGGNAGRQGRQSRVWRRTGGIGRSGQRIACGVGGARNWRGGRAGARRENQEQGGRRKSLPTP